MPPAARRCCTVLPSRERLAAHPLPRQQRVVRQNRTPAHRSSGTAARAPPPAPWPAALRKRQRRHTLCCSDADVDAACILFSACGADRLPHASASPHRRSVSVPPSNNPGGPPGGRLAWQRDLVQEVVVAQQSHMALGEVPDTQKARGAGRTRVKRRRLGGGDDTCIGGRPTFSHRCDVQTHTWQLPDSLARLWSAPLRSSPPSPPQRPRLPPPPRLSRCGRPHAARVGSVDASRRSTGGQRSAALGRHSPRCC